MAHLPQILFCRFYFADFIFDWRIFILILNGTDLLSQLNLTRRKNRRPALRLLHDNHARWRRRGKNVADR